MARSAARSTGDDGFTTIELMIVLLVMGILLAIAIPVFLGTTATADDRSAQSNLNTALTDAVSLYQNGGQTFDVNGSANSVAFAGKLAGIQPSLVFTQGSSGSLSEVSVNVSSDGNGLVMAAYSVPGDCFYVVDNAGSLIPSAIAGPPYKGLSTVGASPLGLPSGTIGLPTATGTYFVEVKGDQTKSDCNSSQPKTSGPPATVGYTTSGFPN